MAFTPICGPISNRTNGIRRSVEKLLKVLEINCTESFRLNVFLMCSFITFGITPKLYKYYINGYRMAAAENFKWKIHWTYSVRTHAMINYAILVIGNYFSLSTTNFSSTKSKKNTILRRFRRFFGQRTSCYRKLASSLLASKGQTLSM